MQRFKHYYFILNKALQIVLAYYNFEHDRQAFWEFCWHNIGRIYRHYYSWLSPACIEARASQVCGNFWRCFKQRRQAWLVEKKQNMRLTYHYDREHVRVILVVHPSSAAAKQLYHMYSCLSNSFKLIIDRPALAVWRTILKHWVMLVSYFVLSTNFVRIMWKISLTSIMGKISGNNKLCKNWGIAFLGKNKGMNCKALILKPY